jgi:hypothetical protein
MHSPLNVKVTHIYFSPTACLGTVFILHTLFYCSFITSLLHFAGMGQGIVPSPKSPDPLKPITHLIQGAAGRGGLSPRVN